MAALIALVPFAAVVVDHADVLTLFPEQGVRGKLNGAAVIEQARAIADGGEFRARHGCFQVMGLEKPVMVWVLKDCLIIQPRQAG